MGPADWLPPPFRVAAIGQVRVWLQIGSGPFTDPTEADPMLRSNQLAVLALLVCAGCATHVGPAPQPGVPVRSWQVRASDGSSAQLYLRNDATRSQTVSMITLIGCVNTRETCADYPVHLVIEPGKTVVGMKVQRFTTGRTWSFVASIRVDLDSLAGEPPTIVPAVRRIIPADQFRTIDVEEFVPAVRAITSAGNCGIMQRGTLSTGSIALVMFFAPSKRSKPERMVSVIYDADGNAISYSDMRGDFFTPKEGTPDTPPARPRTTISLTPGTQSGMLRNDGGGLPETWYQVNGLGLLTAASLGRPAEVIAKIWKECRATR